jgi:putative SOS response-associated peptidase YedK
MCGRFTLTVSGETIADFFGLTEVPTLAPRYNVAPTQALLAVRVPAPEAPRQAARLRWGLVPSWAKDPRIGNQLLNARAETAAEKPAFRTALRRRRCLIPADGFYEWQQRGGAKQPYCFRLSDDRLFAFAGLWERWQDPSGQTLETCTVLTTEANELVRPIHDRMPVLLARNHFADWLDPNLQDSVRLLAMLRAYPAEEMRAYPVSAWVSNPRHEDSRCLAPLCE